MKKLFFVLSILSLTFISAIASNDKADKPETPATTFSMSGKVLDAVTGEALAGAIVEIEGSNISVFTDLDGQFSINNIQRGTYSLKVKYISYEDKKIDAVKVEAQNNQLEVNLKSK